MSKLLQLLSDMTPVSSCGCSEDLDTEYVHVVTWLPNISMSRIDHINGLDVVPSKS